MVTLKKIEEKLSRKNIYLFTFLILVLCAIFYGVKISWREVIEKIIFNPIWPVSIVILDTYLQHRDEKIIKDYREQLSSVGAAIHTAKNMGDGESVPIEIVLDSLSGDNLLQKLQDEKEMKRLEEKTTEAGNVTKKSINLRDI